MANNISAAMTSAPVSLFRQRRLARIGVADNGHRLKLGLLAHGAMALTMGAHAVQLTFDVSDAPVDFPTVRFQLRLTRTAQAHTAARPARTATCLASQMGPHPGQARHTILKLGQLNLELALARLSVLGKDIENERRPVDHFDVLAKYALQLSLVARRQLIIHDNHIGIQFFDQRLNLLHFARPHVGRRIGLVHPLERHADHIKARGVGQPLQLFQAFFNGQQRGYITQICSHKESALPRSGRLIRAWFRSGLLPGTPRLIKLRSVNQSGNGHLTRMLNAVLQEYGLLGLRRHRQLPF